MSESAEIRQETEAPVADDRELVDRAGHGDRAALEQLVARYVDDVFDAALRVLGDPELARDAAQDAFVHALGGLARFRREASFRTWLLRIAVNTARSVHRRRRRRRELPLSLVPDPPGRGRDPAEAAVDRLEVERVEAALQELPPKQRMSVALRLKHGLSYREIAEVTGSTEGASRVNYHTGMKRLRERLR